MRYYDHRFGVVSDVRVASPRRGMSGCHGLGCLGNLGAEDCAKYQNLYQIYARLSKKDKKKETIARAKQLAQDNLAQYQACVQRNAAPAPTPPVPVVPTPITTPPSVSPEPVPYVPMYGGGGGGGGGGGVPEMVPMPDGSDGAVMSSGYCVDAAGNQIACPQTGGPGPVPVQQQPQLYTDPSTGQQFYFNPATGQQTYVTPAAQTGLQLQSQALTPVAYVQMPTNGGGGGGGGGELVPYGEDASFAQPSAMPMPASYGAPASYGQQQAGQTINEKDMIAQNGPTEYTDKWGTIQVLGLVFPAAQARAAAAAAATISPAGTGVQPGGEMKVEDFTSSYVLEGGWW